MRQMAQISTPSPTQQSKMDSFQLIKSKMESQKVRKSARERERETQSNKRKKKRREKKDPVGDQSIGFESRETLEMDEICNQEGGRRQEEEAKCQMPKHGPLIWVDLRGSTVSLDLS